MTLSPFLNRKFKRRTLAYKDATISDFSGGLNAADNDLTMQTKYAKVLKNFQRNSDGSLAVRWGTALKYDITGVVSGDIIELVYFNKHLIVFTTTGQIAKITEEGVITKIWDDTIAGDLTGNPDGWSDNAAIGSIDTTEYKGELIATNGVDKPIIIAEDMTVDYLQDLATGSNVNTPIGKYITTVANYVVVAGVSSEEGAIWVSSAGTSGVFVGDADPNDGITLNLASYVPQNSKDIIGLTSFRNFLMVFFEGALVIVEMGLYDGDGNHTPAVQDNIADHGVINHRTFITTKNDLFMADMLGWHTAQRNQFGLIETTDVSELIDPVYQAAVPFDPDERAKTFAIWNPLEHRIMLHVHGESTWVLSYKKEGSKRDYAWSQFEGLSFDCGTTSEKGRIFFGTGSKIFQYGNNIFEQEDHNADRLYDTDGDWVTATNYTIGDLVTFDGKSYKTLVTHTSGIFSNDLASNYWEEYLGDEISFDWELPWTDINRRSIKKQLKYIQADTQGTAIFDVSIFVDNYYKDENDDYNPAAMLNFVAGTSGGYGAGDQPYGGGRRLRDERPWSMPSDFKIMKIRVHGSSRKPLRIITVTIMYLIGTHKR